jgi:hypothetical protein
LTLARLAVQIPRKIYEELRARAAAHWETVLGVGTNSRFGRKAATRHASWLLLEKEPEAFVPAARRLLGRLASERAMPLRQLADVTATLAELEADPAISRAPRLLSLVQNAPT